MEEEADDILELLVVRNTDGIKSSKGKILRNFQIGDHFVYLGILIKEKEEKQNEIICTLEKGAQFYQHETSRVE